MDGYTYFCREMGCFEDYTSEMLQTCWDTMHQQERDEWADSAQEAEVYND